MNSNLYFIFVSLLLFSFCLCELSVGQKDKLLNGFISYYNNLPNQVYTCQEGFLQNTQQVNDTTYQIVVDIKVTDISNVDVIKTLQCTATIKELETSVFVNNNVCRGIGDRRTSETSQAETPQAQVEVTEPTVERRPVQLDNEVQDSVITSGEQFIAVPRDQPSAPCAGCASHVNPQAAGVTDLANLGVRHLDIHEPTVKHSLETVLDVERQVQVVNGVRYILTQTINFNKCTEQELEDCTSSRICKITILVKPWVKLPNGGNYKAILANNCTEEWQYGDDGEVVPEPPTTAEHGETDGSDDDIQIKHNKNLDAQRISNRERTLTDQELKNIQDQIIPNSRFQEITEPDQESITSSDTSGMSKQHVFKVESGKNSKNSIPGTVATNTEQPPININADKKKAIDDLLAYFDFSGLKPKTESDEAIPRVRRSYDYDLQVLSLAEDYHGIKKSIENARLMYDMAQAMVDYLNEMDMEIKNRAVKDVVRAEEEFDNLQRFVYVQARVIIPCDKVECEPRDEVIQICNGVIDGTNENSPQILNTFCYNDYKERDYRDVIKEISLDDPVLQRLANEAMKKMESESTSKYAMKINKIVSANTQVTSGTLTKFSIIIDFIKCNKSVPLLLRVNCTVVEHLGSKICEVIVHERHWLKERKISYTCTDRPVDMRISKSKSKSIIKNITVDDPKVIDMLQEAVQYLETQSNKNNKQKIVNIKSISSQIVAGFLIKIEFVVGYTNCTDENYSRDEINKCEVMINEGLRLCKAQIWDRSWIIDGRQVEVSCDDIAKNNEIEKMRKKRSIDLGGEVRQDINDSNLEYLTLAKESLKKFLQSTSSVQHYKVVKVNSATSQDVAGKLVRIEFSISPTNCQIRSDGLLSSSECYIVNSKNLFTCRSKILENVWLEKKQYFVNCNTKEQEQQTKQTRSSELKEHNPNELKYHQLAEESMKKYLHDTGNLLYHRIVQVQRVTTQIVSGLLTSIDFIISTRNETDNENNTKTCCSKILEKHWLGTKDINVTCQMQENKLSKPIDPKPDDPKYMQIAVESLQKFIKNNPESHLFRVTFVENVIQAGKVTKIRFLASHTENDDGDTLCHAEYTEQGPFRNDIEVKCYSIGTVLKRSEVTEDDPKYYEYVHLADESLHHYLQGINSSKLYTIINIENITVQWEDGIKTLINFIASPVDLDDSEMHGKRCLSQIHEQPWLHNSHIDVKCELDENLYRTKREIPGGYQESNHTDPKYKKLAEESLQKYVQDSGITQPLEIVRISRVTTQVVAGTMIRIDFLVKHDSNLLSCHSDIWEQSWANKKDIKVSCQNDNYRAKRGIPGGLEEKDPSDDAYKKLAEESLRKYEQETGITQPLQVVQVVKVTTQVVAGTMTRIDFVGKHDLKLLSCHSEIWEQPWENKKDIKVSCKNDERRSKRHSMMTGGLMKQNPTDPEYQQLAEESLLKYVQESGITQPLEVIRVVEVTTQIVSGLMTRIDFVVSSKQESEILSCHSEIWEQPWENKKDIKVSCQNDNHRAKRGMPGGLEEKDPSDHAYKKLAEESLRKYEQETGIMQPLQVVQVVKVTTQVVAGTMTRIDFVGKQDSNLLSCHSEIWERPWENKKDIKVSCQNDNHRAKRGIPGGLEEKDPSDDAYKKLAEESLRKYEQETGITQPLQVVQVVKVTTQVVAGTMTRIDFVGKHDLKLLSCHSEIWEQPWENKKDIKVSCKNDERRSKRHSMMTGGLMKQNPTDPEYHQLAEESLLKYVQESGITQPLEVVRVVEVTTQIVSGLMTRIDFVVKQDSNLLSCHSDIWEQPWENKKDIKVSCQIDNHRAKRGMPGGLEEKDPSDNAYKKLAEESLRKYEQETGITQPLQVVQVVKVTTQVVAGTMTRIDFVGKQDSNLLSCHSEIWERPWENKKDIKVSCQNDNHRAKRGIPGGLEEKDPSDDAYKKLAEESLRKYEQETGITQPLQVVQVVKVTTQIVAGTMTRIDFVGKHDLKLLSCHSEIWEQPWENKKDIKVSCKNDERRSKRHSMMTGGLMKQNPTDPEYQQLAEESLLKYVQESGITQPLEVIRVVEVTTQIVSGLMTRIDFVVSSKQESEILSCHSEIWEQPWENKKDIKVSCQNDNHRAKRGMPGGLEEKDPSDHAYKKLAEESLRKYEHETAITQPLQVVQVVKVTTQVVAGTMTRIDFVGKQDSNLLSCHSEIWERPWENKKDIKVSCQNDNHRAKRGIPGGLEEKDPSDDAYKKLAEESLRKYEQETGIMQPLQVVQVVKVTTQVVAGTMTRIDFVGKHDLKLLSCHSEIWEQPWENKKDIKVSCKNDERRSKRHSMMTGGLMKQNPTDPEYQQLAEESLLKYVQESGITQPLEVVRVVEVTTQIVSGLMTRIDFVVKQDSNLLSCHSEIWEQPWENKKDIKVSCQIDNHRAKRGMPGGLEEKDPSDNAYKKLAEESLRKYEQETGITQPLQVVQVVKVTTQVVAGTMTRIDFVGKQDSNLLSCHSEIWERPWENKKDIKVSCQNDNHRAKRGIPGGLEEKDPSDDAYKKLAEESLRKYEQETGITQPLQVVQVVKVTTQVVAGTMTRIDFVGKHDLKLLSCHSEIWEQPWENKKDIKVSCKNDERRSKRHSMMTGGLMKQNPTDPEYQQLAEESLLKYVQESGITQPLEVVRVVEVTTQIVSGLMTRIDFVVKQDSNLLSCHSEIWEQPWENKKDIKVSCQIDNHRAKRGMPGGLEEKDPSDNAYKKLAEESLRKYEQETGITQPLQVVQVVKVTTQVVAGTMTRIDFVVKHDLKLLSCHSEIWEQPWENKKDIKVSCKNDERRSKRHSMMTGGLMKQNPTDPEYQQLAEESLLKYVQESGITQPLEVIRVVEVTTQIVSGLMTRIDFVVSSKQESEILSCHSEIWEQPWENKKDIKVSCQNDNHRAKRGMPGGLEEKDPTDHAYKKLAEESLRKYEHETGITQPLQVVQVVKVTTQVVAGTMTRIDFVGKQDSNLLSCHSEIWEQPWENKKDIKVSCQNDNHRAKRGMPGGLEEKDPSDHAYKKLAEESLRKYEQETGIMQPLQVVQVVKVTTQVVAGTMTRIDFVGKQDSNLLSCHSEIWEQPWENKKDIKVSCQNDNHRAKRGMPGGLEEKDPSDDAYKKLAEESLRKYEQETGITQPLQVVQVVKVTTQVVAGTMTRIDFVGKQDSYLLSCHSEIWEQPWKNKKDIKVSCQNDNHRAKRGMPGGLEEKDPSNSAYKMLAEESLRKYEHETGITQPLQVVQVVKVTTQVVAGTMTRIDFVVKQDSNLLSCHSEIWERPWENKKDIKVSCQNDNHRAKRGIPGGLEEKDPSDHAYKKLAEESLRKYEQETGITQPLQVVQVVKVTTQVVAGTMTRIDFVGKQDSNLLSCHSEIWEQPWENKKDIKVSCENDERRSKRHSMMTGGLMKQNPTDPEYQQLAEESLLKYVQESGITQPLEVIRVVEVTTQIVSGLMTRIDFVVSSKQESEILSCHSEIWEQPWENKKDIKVSCQNDNHRAKRGMPGGLEEKDPSDHAYKKLAEESLRKYEHETGITQQLEVVQVVKVTTQVVAGTMTRIDFVGKQDSNLLSCHSEIWEQPWENKKDIKVSCQNDNHRAKRAMPGGLEEKDPSDHAYKMLAEESLRKYEHETGITQPLQVVQVVKVTTQVVAGMMTRIDFVVKQDSNLLSCHSEIWEQPWENKKDIKVSCQNDNHRAKRGILGGLEEQDPSNPAYKKLAEESLQKYLTNSGNRDPYRLVNVTKVSTQVVSGLNTLIDFTMAPSDNPSSIIYCHSKIWEQQWLNKREINVNCDVKNKASRQKRELIEGNTYKNNDLNVSNSRGETKEEQDPNQLKYKQLAQESLRKYQQKSTIYHKVIDVKRVLMRVVSGFKYEIDFSAAPTVCSVNVSDVNAQYCKEIVDVILNCHSDIWDRPWLKQKKIDIQCYGPDEEDFEDYGSDDSREMFKSSNQKDNNEKKYILLAEEASEKYLAISKKPYVHKVTDIHSVTENIADGTITKIEYSLSPTICLRNETSSSNDTCKIKKPIIVFHCYAKIWDRPWLNLEKDIKVSCKKDSNNKSKKYKRELGVRAIRQIGDDDDEMDEDIVYYYVDRAVQHVNDQSQSNNLHKLITIHAVQNSMQMDTVTIKMYIEIAETYCLRHHKDMNLHDCEEMDGLNHRLCFVRLWPSPDDELIVRHVSVVCDDEQDFVSVTGVNIPELLRMSIADLERSPDVTYKLVHQGEPQIIPSLDSKVPFKLNFVVGTTNCSKDVNLRDNPFQCYLNTAIPSTFCHSFIWLKAETKFIRYINAKCTPVPRSRRALSDPANVALENVEIQKLVSLSLEKLEMSSLHRYKQRVLQINSHSTKITSGKVTTIDFDVGYTSCLKYEWVENITSCDFLEHLPRRRCVAQIFERLWINNGKNIDVNCVDDETPLESHIEFESAEMANELAREALKHIEAKYPHPNKQKVVRIFSLEKQVVAGIHYRLKVEVGLTDCVALSEQTDCKLEKNLGLNKFCRVNVWVRPWTDHPPNFRVSCDFQEGTSHDFYHHVQAEHLFYNFLTTYNPSYVNDYNQMQKRFEIFKTNIKKIHEFNVHEKGTATYGVTRFTDLTYEEFSSTYMGLNRNLRDANQIPMKKADVPDIKIPQNFDWREYDAVTDVKDQGSCGSCWAFSVTGNIEGQWKMQSGQLVSLSEQELVDCDKLDQGCNGGLPDNAYRAIEQMGGLELESDYPYEAVDEKCVFNKTLAKVQISGAVNITTNETGMAQWLVHNGPISIGINANAMQFYMGGISHPWKMLCNPTNLDHGVLIVGYGIKDYPLFHKQLPYWIVKNSWGKSWGEQGYYRVYRGDGTCGVNQMASSAVI